LPTDVEASGLVHTASGVFINDDGVSVDLTDKQNYYTMNFTATQSTQIAIMDFHRVNITAETLNNNDLLG
jgi:hypothetical protein